MCPQRWKGVGSACSVLFTDTLFSTHATGSSPSGAALRVLCQPGTCQGSCCLQSLHGALSPSTVRTTDSQEGRWQRGHRLPQQSWAWEPLPDSPQDISPPTPCPGCLWPPLLFPAPGGEAEPGWELQSRAFTFLFPSPIFKSFSSKMIRQVGTALPVGCRNSPSHGMHAWPQARHHHTPITPGEVSPPCQVGQGDKSLSIHQHWEGGALVSVLHLSGWRWQHQPLCPTAAY